MSRHRRAKREPLRSVALRSPNVRLSSAPSVRGWQRADGRRWEPNGQMRSHYMTGVFIGAALPCSPPRHRHAAKIRELGGSLAHICDVWTSDSAGLCAQAHRARTGQQKFRPDVLPELQPTAGVGTPPPKKGRTKYFYFFQQMRRGRVYTLNSAWMCHDLAKEWNQVTQLVNNKQLASVCVLCPCMGLFACMTVSSGHNYSNDLLNVKWTVVGRKHQAGALAGSSLAFYALIVRQLLWSVSRRRRDPRNGARGSLRFTSGSARRYWHSGLFPSFSSKHSRHWQLLRRKEHKPSAQ